MATLIQREKPSLRLTSLLDHVDVGGADAIFRGELGRAGTLVTLSRDGGTHLHRILGRPALATLDTRPPGLGFSCLGLLLSL